jgi:HD-GYP domain-containing protein (c-di-GMP phosphodiesterase class II)
LTDSEWEKIKKHPVYAQEMLSEIEFLHPALDIPYCHHEKWDGSGYPRGLKEGRIPIAARIFSVIDVWEALTSQRPYRDPWPEEKAVQYILKHSGTHFDPEVVDAWMDAFDIEPPQEEIKSIYG